MQPPLPPEGRGPSILGSAPRARLKPSLSVCLSFPTKCWYSGPEKTSQLLGGHCFSQMVTVLKEVTPLSSIPKQGARVRKRPSAGLVPDTRSQETVRATLQSPTPCSQRPSSGLPSASLKPPAQEVPQVGSWVSNRQQRRQCSPRCPAVFGNPVQAAAYGSACGSAVAE